MLAALLRVEAGRPAGAPPFGFNGVKVRGERGEERGGEAIVRRGRKGDLPDCWVRAGKVRRGGHAGSLSGLR